MPRQTLLDICNAVDVPAVSYTHLADPQAVRAGHCSGSIAHGWAPVGALHIHLTLAPGESRSILFGLGLSLIHI